LHIIFLSVLFTATPATCCSQ